MLLQLAWSKPLEGLGLPGLGNGSRPACASSQTLAQPGGQPAPRPVELLPVDLQDSMEVKILDPSEVKFQVRLPPVSLKTSSPTQTRAASPPNNTTSPSSSSSPPPPQRQDVEVKVVDASSTSSSPTRTTSQSPLHRHPLGSLERMKASLSKDSGGFDSGFSSAEQQWSDLDTARHGSSTESSAEGEVNPAKALLAPATRPATTTTSTTNEATPLMTAVTMDDDDDLPPPPFCDDDDLPPPPPSPPRSDVCVSYSKTHTIV